MTDHSKWKRLGKGDLPTEDAELGLGHIVPIPVYNIVFVALLILTALTVWAASWHVSATTHLIVASLIALVKATVVTLVFMHLWFEKKILWVIVVYPLFILGLMILGTTGDSSVKIRDLPAHLKVEMNSDKSFGIKDGLKPKSLE